MENLPSLLAGCSLATAIGIIIGYVRVKHTLKQEIVDPDIERLEKAFALYKDEVSRKLAKLEEENNRMSDKLDRKFDELNSKMDKTSQSVSQMQGMLTAMFNRDNQYGQYGQ